MAAPAQPNQQRPGNPAQQNAEPLYVCANCLRVQTIRRENALFCPYCAHETGASKVFFKKRMEATTYDAR